MGAETIPILPSADFDLSASFWAEFGFVELGRWPDYLIVGHPQLEIELHFWLNSKVDRWTNDVACYVRFDSPDAAVACHAGWSGIAVPEPAVLSSPKSEPWGAVEFPRDRPARQSGATRRVPACLNRSDQAGLSQTER